jgi:L-fucose/D-arabinose isomerase
MEDRMNKRKVGILTFSDGRDFAHKLQYDMNLEFQNRLARALEATGEVEVVVGDLIWTTALARSEGRKLRDAGVECTILNYAIWAFPHFTSIATELAPGPLLLFSNINPQYPGLVAMLAAAGSLDQIGLFHARISGDIEDAGTLDRVMRFVRAASATSLLRGETYGVFGGRSMGMYTATVDLAQWRRQFGIDIEHIDQGEIVRLSADVPQEQVTRAREWLERHAGEVRYDGKALTPEKLERQIRSYYATRRLIEQWDLDFIGIKGQPELTNNFATMDLTEAFLNDPYDWDGPHEPIVCATEADSDAALTMEIFKHLARTPVLFADVRHYDAEYDFWDLVNSGQHATYFAAKSFDPAENMPRVKLLPETFYFPAGGASVFHIAHPGPVTLGRLTRKNGEYWMAILPAEFLELPPEVAERKAAATSAEWPHAFARLRVPPATFIDTYASNHIHGVYGDYVEELIWVCKILGIGYRVYA